MNLVQLTCSKPPILFGDRYEAVAEPQSKGALLIVRTIDRRSGRPMTIRLLPRRSDKKSFFRDVAATRLVATLTHPHVEKIVDAGFCADLSAWFAMSRPRGQTLAERLLERGALAPSEATSIVRQILSGLGGAHRRDVVHGSLRTTSILLSEMGVNTSFVTLIDFATSAAAPRHATPAAMLADIRATGAILHECIVGRRLSLDLGRPRRIAGARGASLLALAVEAMSGAIPGAVDFADRLARISAACEHA